MVAWAVSGPLLGFSDTWQLVVNTGTTIVTFLIVFLIQNTQNHDAIAVHLKLDEVIRYARRGPGSSISTSPPTRSSRKLHAEFRRLHEREERRSKRR